jgi:hypothetical protein
MVGFEEDWNGQTNSFTENESEATRQKIIAQLENNAQLWAELLGVTRGALELSKCSYHILAWQFKVTGGPALRTDKLRFQGVKDPVTGEDQKLEYISPYAARKTLGHYKIRSARNESNIVDWRIRAKNRWSFCISVPWLRKKHGHFTMHAIYQVSGIPLQTHNLQRLNQPISNAKQCHS